VVAAGLALAAVEGLDAKERRGGGRRHHFSALELSLGVPLSHCYAMLPH
jgi:hypothetical protein